jgi:hypothetical protein
VRVCLLAALIALLAAPSAAATLYEISGRTAGSMPSGEAPPRRRERARLSDGVRTRRGRTERRLGAP